MVLELSNFFVAKLFCIMKFILWRTMLLFNIKKYREKSINIFKMYHRVILDCFAYFLIWIEFPLYLWNTKSISSDFNIKSNEFHLLNTTHKQQSPSLNLSVTLIDRHGNIRSLDRDVKGSFWVTWWLSRAFYVDIFRRGNKSRKGQIHPHTPSSQTEERVGRISLIAILLVNPL